MEKLVRDNIISIILSKWEVPKYRQVFWKEKLAFLLLKLLEEAKELQEDKNIEEFADVLEVIDALKKEFWFTDDEIEKTRKQKYDKNWWFQEWYILEKN